ncbi:hypothetical protein FBU59_005882, partial [Linderina macrospora]
GDDGGDRYIPHYERGGSGGGARDRERDRDRSGDRYQSGGRYGGNGGYNSGHRGYAGRGGRGGRGGDMDGGYSGNGGDMGGRGGVSGGMLDPRSYDQVVPFKYYAEWLKTQDGGRRLEQDEIRERYEDYRREALQRLYTQFYAAHKDDDWFQERFDPERRKQYMEILRARKASNLEDFVENLASGRYDNLTMTASTEQVMQHEVNRRDQSNINRLGADDDVDSDSETYCLFVRTVPPSVSRGTLETELKKQPGFKYLALSEPRQDKQYHRFGWVRFDKGTDMDKVLESLSNLKIDEFQFHFSRHTNNSSAAMRLAPDVASTEDRLRHDLKLVREAVQSLDARTDSATFHGFDQIQGKIKELGGTIAEDADGDADVAMEEEEGGAGRNEDGESGEIKGDIEAVRRELDLMIEYLRRVHYYCYYCGHTADNGEDFHRR